MDRSVRLPRLAAGLALIPFVASAASFAAACGGSDVIDGPDAADATTLPPDSALIDATELGEDAPELGEDAPEPAEEGLPEAGMADADAAVADADAEAEAQLDADADAKHDADADAAILDANILDVGLDVDAGHFFDSGTGPLLVSLGTADPFVVLGGATVTNSGISTVLLGDVGTTGPSVTGLTGPPFQPSGKTEINNARATQAVLDLGTAYTALSSKPCPPSNNLTGHDLGGRTLAPGVYCFSSTAGQITGTTLTFDAKGDPNAVWIIQVGTALTVMDNATAIVIGGPPSLACRIFWTTGTAATLNGGSHMVGNILASSKTSMLTNATLSPGRAFGRTAGVTLLSNTVSAALCP